VKCAVYVNADGLARGNAIFDSVDKLHVTNHLLRVLGGK
jgi:hypothetical protein